MHNLLKFWLLSLLITLAACTGKEEESPADVEPPKQQLPEGFTHFYEKFHTDSAFQMNHIQFPLQGVPENRALATDTFTFQKENWELHQAFNPSSSTFERRFQNVGQNIVIEYIYSPRLQVVMERRFQRRDSSWFLIFYKELGERQDVAPEDQ